MIAQKFYNQGNNVVICQTNRGRDTYEDLIQQDHRRGPHSFNYNAHVAKATLHFDYYPLNHSDYTKNDYFILLLPR